MISRGSLLRAHRWSQPAVQLKALTDRDPCCLWALVMHHEPFPSLQAPSVLPPWQLDSRGVLYQLMKLMTVWHLAEIFIFVFSPQFSPFTLLG